MILVGHIAIALLGIIISLAVVFRPSRALLQLSAAAIALTLATGTYLVVSVHAGLASACMSGLAYLSVTVFLRSIGRHKLTVQLLQSIKH